MRKLLFGIVFLIGCRTWTPKPRNPDPGADVRVCANTSVDASRAIAVWDRALGAWHHVVLAFDDCDVVIDEVATPEPWCGLTLGLGGAHILLNSKCHAATEIVVAHELGHTFGAQHLPGGLMAPSTQEAEAWGLCPDRATVAQVAAYHRVALGNLSYCY